MRLARTMCCLSFLLVSTLAPAQDQGQSGLNGFLKGVANSVSTAAQAKSSVRKSDSGKRLRDTGLAGIFNAASSTEWPRLAVTINKLPRWFYYSPPSGMPGRYSPNDCINISITAWQDKKSAKTYDNLDFCGDDIITETPFSDVGLMWKNFGSASGTSNTGAVRTAGPMPPERLFPNKPGLDMFFHLNGGYYVGSIMATLGYNWKEPQDFRFWVVNLPTQAESMHGVSVSTPPQGNPSAGSNGDDMSKPDTASSAITAKCAPQNFTTEKFSRIAVGMTLEQVNNLIGCQFDPEFTQTSTAMKMYMWDAKRGSQIAGYVIRVFFDPTGTKVKGAGPMFKSSEGF